MSVNPIQVAVVVVVAAAADAGQLSAINYRPNI